MYDFIHQEQLQKITPIIETAVPPSTAPFLVDVVFSFDTTGSMRSVIDSVRNNLAETVDRLYREIEGIRIGIMVHGDYCDFPEMFWKLELNKDAEVTKTFIKNSKNTSGGDFDECYELVLREAQKFEWKAEVKVLVVIGDANPHEFGYEMPKSREKRMQGFDPLLHIDWVKELQQLKSQNITVFACHAKPTEHTKRFYQRIAVETNGFYFPLDDLQAFKDYMVAICLRATDGAEDMQLLREKQRELAQQYRAEVEALKQQAISKIQASEEMKEEEKEAAVKEILGTSLENSEHIKKILVSAGCYSEELHTISKESSDVLDALHSAKKQSVFSPQTAGVASRLRANKMLRTRSETFEEELAVKSQGFFSNEASSHFMSTITNNRTTPGTPIPPQKLKRRVVPREDDDSLLLTPVKPGQRMWMKREEKKEKKDSDDLW